MYYSERYESERNIKRYVASPCGATRRKKGETANEFEDLYRHFHCNLLRHTF